MHERIDNINPRADLAGIEQGGYKLVYTDKPSPSLATIASLGSRRAGGSFWYSLGINITTDGTISDVRWNSPADKAQLAPGYKVMAVNGHVFSADALKEAVTAAKGNTEPIHLITQSDSLVNPVDIDYHDGLRFPRLVRAEGTPAYLDDITKPLTTPQSAPEKKADGDSN